MLRNRTPAGKTQLRKWKSKSLFAVGFIFRREAKKSTYYVCNTYGREFLSS